MGNFAGTHINTTTSACHSPEDTVLSLPVVPLARSNESPLDSHNTVVTPISVHNSWSLRLATPLFLGLPQVCEHSVSLFDQGIDSSPFTIENNELDRGITQSQLAQSHLHLPHIDWRSNEQPLLPYDDQATIPVSIIVYPQST